MSEDVHDSTVAVPVTNEAPGFVAPNVSTPPIEAGWSETCRCGFVMQDIRENSTIWNFNRFPDDWTDVMLYACPHCNRVLRTYIIARRRQPK
jgi:hypothetical protein